VASLVCQWESLYLSQVRSNIKAGERKQLKEKNVGQLGDTRVGSNRSTQHLMLRHKEIPSVSITKGGYHHIGQAPIAQEKTSRG